MSNIRFYVPKLKEVGAWEDWRANYKGGFGWWGDNPLSRYKYVVVHHTDTERSGSAKKDVDYIKRIADIRGFGGIPYHFLITSEYVNGYAKVIYVGDIGARRAHTVNRKGSFGLPVKQGNLYTLGVSFIGRHQNKLPDPEQYRSAHWLIKELVENEGKRLTGLKGWGSVKGHKEFDPTFCPAANLSGFLSTIQNAENIFPITDNKVPSEVEKLQKQIEELEKQKQKELAKLENDLQLQHLTEKNLLESQLEDLQKKLKEIEKELSKYELIESPINTDVITTIITEEPKSKNFITGLISKWSTWVDKTFQGDTMRSLLKYDILFYIVGNAVNFVTILGTRYGIDPTMLNAIMTVVVTIKNIITKFYDKNNDGKLDKQDYL